MKKMSTLSTLRARTVVINDLEPLDDDTLDRIESLSFVPPWLRAYAHFRQHVEGRVPFTQRQLSSPVVFGRHESRDERLARYELLERKGLITYLTSWYGENRQMASIRLNEIDPADFKRLLDEVSDTTSEVKRFLEHYVDLYRKYTKTDYEATGKDRGLARRLCGEYPLPRLTKMVTDFFQLREGLRPDYKMGTFFDMRSKLAMWEREERAAARYELKPVPKSETLEVEMTDEEEAELEKKHLEKIRRHRRGRAPGKAFG
jgi:hypothetical protein